MHGSNAEAVLLRTMMMKSPYSCFIADKLVVLCLFCRRRLGMY